MSFAWMFGFIRAGVCSFVRVLVRMNDSQGCTNPVALACHHSQLTQTGYRVLTQAGANTQSHKKVSPFHLSLDN